MEIENNDIWQFPGWAVSRLISYHLLRFVIVVAAMMVEVEEKMSVLSRIVVKGSTCSS